MKNKLIKMLATLVCAASMGTLAYAAPISSDRLLGTIVPGTPANPGNEVEMVNFLVTALNGASSVNTYPGAGTDLGDNPADPQGETYTLWDPLGLENTLPTVDGTFSNVVTTNTSVDLTGWSYILAKFGQDSVAYYIGGLSGVYTIPNLTGNQNGLSGYTLINGTPSVPDGGTTALLLGLALIGLGLAGRRAGLAKS